MRVMEIYQFYISLYIFTITSISCYNCRNSTNLVESLYHTDFSQSQTLGLRVNQAQLVNRQCYINKYLVDSLCCQSIVASLYRVMMLLSMRTSRVGILFLGIIDSVFEVMIDSEKVRVEQRDFGGPLSVGTLKESRDLPTTKDIMVHWIDINVGLLGVEVLMRPKDIPITRSREK